MRRLAAADERSQATTSARTPCRSDSSDASSLSRFLRRAVRVTPRPRLASSRAIATPIPEDAPVTRQVDDSLAGGRAMGARGYLSAPMVSLPGR